MSTNRIAIVDLVAAHPIAGAEGADRSDDFILKSPAPLEIAFFLPETRKKFANQRADRGVALGGLDPRATVDVLGQRYGDIFHSNTVSQLTLMANGPGCFIQVG